MFLTSTAQLLYDALLAVAYPQPCAICRRSVEESKLGVACETCWKRTRTFKANETLCWKCGLPLPAEILPELRDQVRCHRCDSQWFTAARAVGPYQGALRETVLFLKRQPHLPRQVESLLVELSKREPLNDSTQIIPVPLHEKRIRSRGFNQAAILARALSQKLSLPIAERNLCRVRFSEKHRAGQDAKGRRESVEGAFEILHPKLTENENILLVDDVFTTGATVSACAEKLLAAGARNVFVVTLARA